MNLDFNENIKQDEKIYQYLNLIFDIDNKMLNNNERDKYIKSLNKYNDEFDLMLTNIKNKLPSDLSVLLNDLFLLNKNLSFNEILIKEKIDKNILFTRYYNLLKTLRHPNYANNFKKFLPIYLKYPDVYFDYLPKYINIERILTNILIENIIDYDKKSLRNIFIKTLNYFYSQIENFKKITINDNEEILLDNSNVIGGEGRKNCLILCVRFSIVKILKDNNINIPVLYKDLFDKIDIANINKINNIVLKEFDC